LLGYQWNGKMRVLNQILSSDWLQNQVRVIGGAYGGFSSIAPNGQIMFHSYRDPNLKETIENYNAIPQYLEKLEVNEKEMTRYILGTIADVDNPLTPSQKGDVAVRYALEKTSAADLQKERDEVIQVSLADIKAMKKIIIDILDQNALCVYGNEDKIQAQKDLFGKVQKLNH
jgi:Zn-dependent M16 (insulinase) family peptidase